MSLDNESGPFELRWEDFTALSKWLKKHPPAKNQGTRKQLRKTSRESQNNRPSIFRGLRVRSFVVWLFLGIMCVALYLTSQGPSFFNMGLGVACLGVGFIVGALMIVAVLAWARVVHVQNEKNFLTLPADEWQRGPWRVRIGPEGIENISSLATSTYRWEVIWSMGRTDDHLIYMITSQRGVAVPRRAFISDEHFDDFAESARRYRREAERILDAELVPTDEEAPRPERPSTDIRL
jgi:hypothetical protein